MIENIFAERTHFVALDVWKFGHPDAAAMHLMRDIGWVGFAFLLCRVNSMPGVSLLSAV